MLGKCSASILIAAALRADHHSSFIMGPKHRVISIYALTNTSQPFGVLLQITLMHKIMDHNADCSFLLAQSFIDWFLRIGEKGKAMQDAQKGKVFNIMHRNLSRCEVTRHKREQRSTQVEFCGIKVWVWSAQMRRMFSTAKLSASLASVPGADNRRRHFPTQFTDALGDAEARPTLSNAIRLPVCFKSKVRVPSLSTAFWLPLLHRCTPHPPPSRLSPSHLVVVIHHGISKPFKAPAQEWRLRSLCIIGFHKVPPSLLNPLDFLSLAVAVCVIRRQENPLEAWRSWRLWEDEEPLRLQNIHEITSFWLLSSFSSVLGTCIRMASFWTHTRGDCRVRAALKAEHQIGHFHLIFIIFSRPVNKINNSP